MVDFKKSFRKGQEAVEQSEASRQEILDVFSDITKQISEVTGLQIFIQPGYMTRKIGGGGFIAGINLTAGIQSALVGIPMPKDNSIIALNNSNGKEARLAGWETESNGYPCTISWANESYRCHDRQSLEEHLADLLEDVFVAEKIRNLMNEELENESDAADEVTSTD